MSSREREGFGLAGLALALSFLTLIPGEIFPGTGLLETFAAESIASPGSMAGADLPGGDLTLSVYCGYGGNARAGRHAPMAIRIENEREEEFSGVLRVTTMEADDEIYSYEYPVTVAGGGSLEKDIYVPLGAGSDQVFVSVENKNGREMNRKRLKIESSRETAELFVGLLSDRPERLSWLDGAGVNFGALETRAFPSPRRNFRSRRSAWTCWTCWWWTTTASGTSRRHRPTPSWTGWRTAG